MFAPDQPKLTKEEIEAGEKDALQFVQRVIVGGFLLYLTPHAVAWVRKML